MHGLLAACIFFSGGLMHGRQTYLNGNLHLQTDDGGGGGGENAKEVTFQFKKNAFCGRTDCSISHGHTHTNVDCAVPPELQSIVDNAEEIMKKSLLGEDPPSGMNAKKQRSQAADCEPNNMEFVNPQSDDEDDLPPLDEVTQSTIEF